ncbi:hypothetical protein QBC38DRAFT_520147 [Podospora fimiseda]|uniref:Nephrocystin 3-like N-terminal domain-containing protein n=1 Tax=Podospora fimiseda TaxID=252190 RepID=A0AAN6YQE3_9PEZI|nr:hypothetical protein QBC38DRAFT_520147 [Podospora fimiseda]
MARLAPSGLLIAKTYVDSFDKLLDAYSDIGDVIPGFVHYKTTFEKHTPLATVLEDYYSDILEFHSKALIMFTRPKWKKLFLVAWKTFDTEFSPILQSLARRRDLLDGEKASAILYEIERVRADIDAMRAAQRQKAHEDDIERHRFRLGQIKEKLQVPDYQLDQEMSTEDCNGSDSGQWIFQDPKFLSWKNMDQSGYKTLFINGKPGAVSPIIERLLEENNGGHLGQSAVAYFYFKHRQQNKNTFNAMLRALFDQLIDQDHAVARDIYEDVSSKPGVSLRATKELESLVRMLLECYQTSYLILDGLDECADGGVTKTIDFLTSIVHPSSNSANTGTKLRLLFAGQRDGVLDTHFASAPSISLDNAGHFRDIGAYTEDFAGKIRRKFQLSAEIEQKIVTLVLNEADGMFLFARQVLENLMGQTKPSGVKKELQPGTFRKGLEKAYDRVAVCILDQSSEARSKDALRMLALVACANRVLFEQEIQAFLCIDPELGQVEEDDCLSANISCKTLCGALVDTHRPGKIAGPEDRVQLVHETARLYLFETRLNRITENIRLSAFCIQYLSSPPFQATTRTANVEDYASQRYYALQDYCVQYWFQHLQHCVKARPNAEEEELDGLIELARRFMISCQVSSKFSEQYLLDDVCHTVDTIKHLPPDVRVLSEYFNLDSLTTRFRDVIEALQSQPPNSGTIFTRLHGRSVTFKCYKPWCDFFTFGFLTRQERHRHSLSHDLPFYCPVDGCFGQSLGFESQARLSQHQKTNHPDPDNDVKFPSLGTNKLLTLCEAVKKRIWRLC